MQALAIEPLRAALLALAGPPQGSLLGAARPGASASAPPGSAAGAPSHGVRLEAACEVLAHAGAHASLATQCALLQELLGPAAEPANPVPCGSAESGGARSAAQAGTVGKPSTQAHAGSGLNVPSSPTPAAAAAAAAVLDFAEGLAARCDGLSECAPDGDAPAVFSAHVAGGLAAVAAAEVAAADQHQDFSRPPSAARLEGAGGDGGGERGEPGDQGSRDRVGLLARMAQGGTAQLCAVVGALARAAGVPGESQGMQPGFKEYPESCVRQRAAERLLARVYLAAPEQVLAALLAHAAGQAGGAASHQELHSEAPRRHAGSELSDDLASVGASEAALTRAREAAAWLQRSALATLADSNPDPDPDSDHHSNSALRRAAALLQRLAAPAAPAADAAAAAGAAQSALALAARHPALLAAQLGALAAWAAPTAAAAGAPGTAASERGAAVQALQRVRCPAVQTYGWSGCWKVLQQAPLPWGCCWMPCACKCQLAGAIASIACGSATVGTAAGALPPPCFWALLPDEAPVHGRSCTNRHMQSATGRELTSMPVKLRAAGLVWCHPAHHMICMALQSIKGPPAALEQVAALLGALLPLLLDRGLPENRAAAVAEGVVDRFDAAPLPPDGAHAPSPGGWVAGFAALAKTLLGTLSVLSRGDLCADPIYVHLADDLADPLARCAAAAGATRGALQGLAATCPGLLRFDALLCAFPSAPAVAALQGALAGPPGPANPPFGGTAARRGAARGRQLLRCCPGAIQDAGLYEGLGWAAGAAWMDNGRGAAGGAGGTLGGPPGASAASAPGHGADAAPQAPEATAAAAAAVREAEAAGGEEPAVLATPRLARALLAATGLPVRCLAMISWFLSFCTYCPGTRWSLHAT